MVLNLFAFRISGFQCPPGHADVTDTTTPADGKRRIAVFLSHCGDALVLKPLRLRARVSLGAFGAHTPWNVSYSSAYFTIESRGGTRTSIRQKSLLSSFPVRSELIVLHNASALAQESATCIPKWKDLGPLRLPCPGTDEPTATCTVPGVRRGTNVATIPVG